MTNMTIVVMETMTASHLAGGWRFGFFIARWNAKKKKTTAVKLATTATRSDRFDYESELQDMQKYANMRKYEK